MMISLDGFFEGQDHDLSWHNVDTEFNAYAAHMLRETDTLLFGRKTYQLMENYWPAAKPSDQNDAIIAEKMNLLPKIVFSKTLEIIKEKPHWRHIRLVKDDSAEAVKEIKNKQGKGITILGSSTLCVSLLEAGLLDELRIMVNPVVIGNGTPLFKGIHNKLTVKLFRTKNFLQGMFCYITTQYMREIIPYGEILY